MATLMHKLMNDQIKLRGSDWDSEAPFSALDHSASVCTAGELNALAQVIVDSMRKMPGDTQASQLVDIVTACECLADRMHTHIKQHQPGSAAQEQIGGICDDLIGLVITAEAFRDAPKPQPATEEEMAGDMADTERELNAH